MKKVYLGIVHLVVFCSMDAMEADLSSKISMQQPGKPRPQQDELNRKRTVFEESIAQNRDVQGVGTDIISYLQAWHASLSENKMFDPNTRKTIKKDLSEAKKALQEKKYEVFKSRIMNAEYLMLGLVRQQERKKLKARIDALKYSAIQSVY